MSYFEEIMELTKTVPSSIADFSLPRDIARTPTQASSNFITNKEQGDWAEDLIFRAINENFDGFVAVRYGKSDDTIAGEDGFDEFYQEFQTELDTIGKRPDLLLFNQEDFNEAFGDNISRIPHSEIEEYVKKAIAGIEVRSSAFLIERYEEAMKLKSTYHTQRALELVKIILNDYRDILEQNQRKKYIPVLENITLETLSVTDFKVPGWSASERLVELNSFFKELKKSIKEIQKRDYLSITPKVEDLKVVYKWVECFNVPHFYFQVFFDKVYGISFKEILEIISDSEKEGVVFNIERDSKNQNKTTIKINSKIAKLIATKVDEPEHESVRKEMDRGRLLFYVTFQGGTAYLDIQNLKSILNLPND